MARQRTVPRVGDRVEVIKSNVTNNLYGVGATGVVTGFRNNRFHGRCAIVVPDSEPDGCVDWVVANIRIIP